MGFFIFLVIVAGIIFLLIRRSKAKKAQNVIVYTEYFAQKRQQFPWFDNWFKENGDPSKSMGTEFLAEKNPSDYVASTIDGYEKGLTLECPSCGCPLSWVMIQKEIVKETEINQLG